MKTKIQKTITAIMLFLIPLLNFAQAPDLGVAGSFALFTTAGAVTNSGVLAHVTGNVGTNGGSSTGFGNVDGGMHDGDTISIPAAADLLLAYDTLNSRIATKFPAPGLGNGQILTPGVHFIGAVASLDLTLTLDGLNDPNALFIIRIQGAFNTSANSKVKLKNGAKACNVFWQVEGAVVMAAGSTMRGTIIAHNAAITMGVNDTLEGRALSIGRAVLIDGIYVWTPLGCTVPVLTGPNAPNLLSTECYGIFSSSGSVSNSGITTVKGDVGTNVGLTTGFDTLLVTGTVHPIPDGSTSQCAADLGVVYSYLNTVPVDIKLVYPAQFGNNLVLTPHTYLLDAATMLTDSIILNAQGNSNAVFILKINGALSTTVGSKVILIGGAQAENVYWKIEGAVSINDNSVFCGTIICNNGALGVTSAGAGVTLNGRALTTTGAFSTTDMSTTMAPVCLTTGITSIEMDQSVTIYPNPFTTSMHVSVDASQINKCELRMYNVLGTEVMNIRITKPSTSLETNNLPKGIYFYKVISNNKIIQSGKLISQQ